MPYTGPWSGEFIEAQYRRWKENPENLEKDWRFFFSGFELGLAESPAAEGTCSVSMVRKQSRVEALIYRYRDIGHFLACLDPLAACPTDHPLLNPAVFDLTPEDMNESFYMPGVSDDVHMPLKNILSHLKQTYCHAVGVEYMHLQDPDEREWLRDRMETSKNQPDLSSEEKIRILNKLSQAKRFEQFLHKKYLGQKRFSLEGAEVIIPMLDILFHRAGSHGCEDVFLGMAHRGRLNVLVNILGKTYTDIFREFEGTINPSEEGPGTGDVKYHKGLKASFRLYDGRDMRVIMANNPSHLEAVNPVVEGMARACLDLLENRQANRVLPVLIHGDAAFAGQGVVAETLNMSQLEGYRTGGTVHIVINNQIGYTTLPEDARSTRYSTDNAKGIMVPIFHVHGEDPDAVIHTVKLACDYRMAFSKDVVIDVVCYRQYGHNEGDEPYFTQPLMYERIRERPSLDKIYADRLLADGILDQKAVETIHSGIESCLEEGLDKARELSQSTGRPDDSGKAPGKDQEPPPSLSGQPVDIRPIDSDTLTGLARKLNAVPENFHLHPKIQKLLERRLQAVVKDDGIDWGNAETLAYASILMENIPIRLSGEDTQRGTFSHRHSVLFDVKNNDEYTPLSALSGKQASFDAVNSLLSEAGVLGFEYGYSVMRPEGLTIWEAQFGDFANNAQVVIDQFIVSGETKWQTKSGLVMFLPHGYEGMGPEHSSARIERFLQLCADDNIQVCNPTTPANFYHLLRRQAIGRILKPLIVFTPKSLLRHPLAVSRLADFTKEGFQAVIDDPTSVKKPEKVLFVSGKLYYELMQAAEKAEQRRIAIVRMEQFHPFPEQEIRRILEQYKGSRRFVWVQEEPQNMGAWCFVQAHMQQYFDMNLEYVGRKPSASPATGYHHVFKEEQDRIINEALVI
ncbi:MAG: 2-oxoglutarate dehydrogenase E1 component [Desulfobacteraceae bacterium]|nr:MAG: 2-oxoglutarate dehydrogenase E1 component [Desulfobacteraceae bacterium]